MKKCTLLLLSIFVLIVSCNDTAEKRTKKWIDEVSGKAYSYEENGIKTWIGFSDYNFVMQTLQPEDSLLGYLINGLAFIASAGLTEYIESPEKNTAIFKIIGDDLFDTEDSYLYFEKNGDTIKCYQSETTNSIKESTNILYIFQYDDYITKKYSTNLMEINEYFYTNRQ